MEAERKNVKVVEKAGALWVEWDCEADTEAAGSPGGDMRAINQ